jgi:hypothetical protein
MLLLLAGCAKTKDAIIEQRALNMLDGTEWKIVHFIQGNKNISADFSTYIFRFNKDLTVNALRNNLPEATGNWLGDIGNRTIYAHFPSVGSPLLLLNATWTITQSTSKSLPANTTVVTEFRELKMEKQ